MNHPRGDGVVSLDGGIVIMDEVSAPNNDSVRVMNREGDGAGRKRKGDGEGDKQRMMLVQQETYIGPESKKGLDWRRRTYNHVLRVQSEIDDIQPFTYHLLATCLLCLASPFPSTLAYFSPLLQTFHRTKTIRSP